MQLEEGNLACPEAVVLIAAIRAAKELHSKCNQMRGCQGDLKMDGSVRKVHDEYP